MEEMKVMLIMLGLIVGGVIAWIIYTNIRNNVGKNSKSISKKAEIMMKKDMSSKCARYTFYMNNDYDNEYSQSEWLRLFKEEVVDKALEKDSEEYAAAVAPFINAIVVEGSYYMRRGMQNMEHSLEKFVPGVNDRISLNYFVEPYEYYKNGDSKKECAKNSYSASQADDRRLTYSEEREIEKAKNEYEKIARYVANGRLTTIYNEADEKRAYAEYMRVLAKYAGKK